MTKLNVKKLLNWKTILLGIILILVITASIIIPKFFLKLQIIDSYTNGNFVGVEYQMTNIGTWDKPVIATLIPNGKESYQIIYSEYERQYLLFYKDTLIFRGNPVTLQNYNSVVGSVNNKSINQVKDIVEKFDLTKYNPEPNNINTVNKTQLPPNEQILQDKKQSAYLPENRAFDPIELIPQNANRGIEDFYNKITAEQKSTDYSPLFKNSEMGGLTGSTGSTLTFTPKEEGYSELQVLITRNPKVKFIALKEKCPPIEVNRRCDEPGLLTLTAVNVVLKDRTIIPVPTKPDGTFDFEAVKDKWE